MNRYGRVALLAAALGCGDDGAGSDQGIDAGATGDAAATLDSATTTADTGSTVRSDASTSACTSEATQQGRVACAANAVLATLSSSELAALKFELSDYTTRSLWNNLPVQLKPRGGGRSTAI